MAHLDLNVLAAEKGADYQVVQFKGEMDKSNLQEIRDVLTKFVEEYPKSLMIFDLTYFDFINSEGVGFLVSLHYKLKEAGKDLKIINVQPKVEDVFSLIGLSQLIKCYSSLEEAVKDTA
jgi:stage II sporulation protein AA (anti-sigma F factor antagonist)